MSLTCHVFPLTIINLDLEFFHQSHLSFALCGSKLLTARNLNGCSSLYCFLNLNWNYLSCLFVCPSQNLICFVWTVSLYDITKLYCRNCGSHFIENYIHFPSLSAFDCSLYKAIRILCLCIGLGIHFWSTFPVLVLLGAIKRYHWS